MKNTLYGILVLCLFVVCKAAQASSVLAFDVATTEEQIQELAQASDTQLSAHLNEITADQIAAQITAVNDGRHVVVLQRILRTLRSLLLIWEPDHSRAVCDALAASNPTIAISFTPAAGDTSASASINVTNVGTNGSLGGSKYDSNNSFSTGSEIEVPGTISQGATR